MNLAPRGELCFLGMMLSLWGEDPLSAPPFFKRRRVCFPGAGERIGEHSPLEIKVHAQGPSSPLGANVIPRGMLLKTGLSYLKGMSSFSFPAVHVRKPDVISR
jgi:hypothetical protein